MHKKNALVTLFALAFPLLVTAHPGHAGHTHDALAGSGHPKVLLLATVLAAGVLIVAAGALLLERDHRHRFRRQTQH